IDKCQALSSELLVQPDAEIVQTHHRRQTGQQARECVRALAFQTEGFEQLVMHRLDNLALTCEPAAQTLRPAYLAVALGWADHLGTIPVSPASVPVVALKSFIDQVRSTRLRSDRVEPRVRVGTGSQEGLGQWLVFGASRRTAKAGDNRIGTHRGEQMH